MLLWSLAEDLDQKDEDQNEIWEQFHWGEGAVLHVEVRFFITLRVGSIHYHICIDYEKSDDAHQNQYSAESTCCSDAHKLGNDNKQDCGCEQDSEGGTHFLHSFPLFVIEEVVTGCDDKDDDDERGDHGSQQQCFDILVHRDLLLAFLLRVDLHRAQRCNSHWETDGLEHPHSIADHLA